MRKQHIEGSGWCSLCKENEESLVHIFIMCPYTKLIWQECSTMLGQGFFVEWYLY
jgi:hypothetical protein